jgi:hypothetical protein
VNPWGLKMLIGHTALNKNRGRIAW